MDNPHFQGSFISTDTIEVKHSYNIAGQLIAKYLKFWPPFAGDFRYVPFDPAKLKVDQNRKLSEDHEVIGDTAWLFLSDPPPTIVPFRYCFEFLDNSADNSGTKFAHRDDIADANIPLCAEGDTVKAQFERGKTTLTNPIILHAKYDALIENQERFYIRVCDLEAAVYADGDRTSTCARLPIDIKNVPKSPISKDFAVTGFMNDPLVLDSFPAMKPDSSLLDEYSVRIDTLVSVGTLTFDGAPVQVGQVIASADLSKLVYKGQPDGWGYPYDYLSFSIVRTSDNAVSDFNYHLIINLVSVIYPVNENSDKGTVVGQIETDMTTPKFVTENHFGGVLHEQRMTDGGFVGHDLVGTFLVVGQTLDEFQDESCLVGPRGPDVETGFHRWLLFVHVCGQHLADAVLSYYLRGRFACQHQHFLAVAVDVELA